MPNLLGGQKPDSSHSSRSHKIAAKLSIIQNPGNHWFWLRCWLSTSRLRFSTQNGNRVNSGFSHSLKMHIGRVRKLASAQAVCGLARAGGAGARAGALVDADSMRGLLLVCAVLSGGVMVAPA